MDRRTFLQLAIGLLGDIFIPFYVRPDNRVYYEGQIVTYEGKTVFYGND